MYTVGLAKQTSSKENESEQLFQFIISRPPSQDYGEIFIKVNPAPRAFGHCIRSLSFSISLSNIIANAYGLTRCACVTWYRFSSDGRSTKPQPTMQHCR